jgi:hypothetical protein
MILGWFVWGDAMWGTQHGRRVFFMHLKCAPKRTIQVSPGAPFWGDSKSGGPNLIPFLTGLKNIKYSPNPGALKFDSPSNLLSSTCFQTYFGRRFWICKQKSLNVPVAPTIPKILIGAPAAGQVIFFNWDHPICTWTHFWRRFQIWKGTVEILTITHLHCFEYILMAIALHRCLLYMSRTCFSIWIQLWCPFYN